MESSNIDQQKRFADLSVEELKALRAELDTGRKSKIGSAYLKSIDRRLSELKEG